MSFPATGAPFEALMESPMHGRRAFLVVCVALSAVACTKHKDAKQGVTPGTQVSPRIVNELRTKGGLGKDEDLLAYYDYTATLDGSEVAYVAADHVAYVKEGNVVSFPLGEVKDVETRKETLIGDVFEIQTESGKTMTVEIAPLNGGDLFAKVLEQVWRKKKPEAAIRRVPR